MAARLQDKSKVIPKPRYTGKKCKLKGCRKIAIGDEFCSTKCCKAFHNVRISTVGYTGGSIGYERNEE